MPAKKNAKQIAPVATKAHARSMARAGTQREATGKATAPAKEQPALFEEAIKAQHSGDFEKAKSLFEQAASGPSREMAHAARVHARMCDHRIAKAAPVLRSAEDHYNFAVTLMNQRSLELAEQHLRTALQMMTDADHIHYALALCRGLRGDLEDARAHLQRAIELQPKNRLMARSDPDFLELNRNPSISRLLHSEGTPSA